jgi:hypothetical protein
MPTLPKQIYRRSVGHHFRSAGRDALKRETEAPVGHKGRVVARSDELLKILNYLVQHVLEKVTENTTM